MSKNSDSQLLAGEMEIETASCHELIVGGRSRQFPFLQDDDHVGLANGAQTMRDNNACPPDHHAAEIVLDGAFGLGIERAGRLVENEDRRVCVECTRDGNTLFLSAR